ncbi:Glyoxylase, beta-lactamase superfamily II [Chitinophaga ginsengisegetis]|uniref:Glyoxylase, beta-lactamase superfamily II n=1 Tax=Chitinophaga ginsengisegetis TaxID=393003 RepID=A0A1T5P1R5_9BACT|nr:MBL fold metallo-hydrolase [Chitinophaga ginsengisegetis]SKD06298.1 Glyoxylase, beta-lactamase superfamily II [Chitinophaga ginsengisegetis]
MKSLHLFSLRGTFVLLLLLNGLLSVRSQPSAHKLPAQPGFYSMQLGDFQVIALSDGTIPLNLTALLHENQKGEVMDLLHQNYLDTTVETSITAYLVRTNNQLILIDAGCGSFLGPTLGKLKKNLVAAGFHPEDISAILLTHLHADHVGGLVNGDKIAFPNATVYISKPEAEFWLTAANKKTANKRAQPFFDPAQAAMIPYQKAGKVKVYDPGTQLFPGISSVNSPGHTPGHSCYALESKGQKLVFWGDMIHAGAVQFADPSVTIDFDVDLSAAADERNKAFENAVKNGYWIAAPHLSFPGIGHLRGDAQQYQWLPVNYSIN